MMRQNFELSTCNDALGLEYNLHLHINRPKRCRFSVVQSALIMSIGVFLGFVVCDLVKHAILVHSLCANDKLVRKPVTNIQWELRPEMEAETRNPNVPKSEEKLVYVGVMTAEKYLNSRARAVHTSWAKSIPGRVEFFTSARIPTDLPVVNLPGVEDSVYPPQKKSFMMLKYMHDNHINDYEWFVRADDDVFIHGDRLSAFLHALNSSRRLYLGQAGQGVHSEHGLLGLDPEENYCMGGTTMIFSRATLRRMVPQINFCIKHLVSTHEDVEIGRCVRKFADTSCPWAFEFRNLFYQNHQEPNGSFTKPGLLHKLHKPITMHPVKESSHLHRMQAHFLDQKLRDLRYKILLLHRDMAKMTKELDGNASHLGFPAEKVLNKVQPKRTEDVIPWVYFDKSYYSPSDQSPKHKIPAALHLGLDDVVQETMRLINSRARELGRHIDFRGLLYGYHRVDPLHSADYVTDLLLNYHRHRGRQLKIPVRRHSYLHRPFTHPEIRFHDKPSNVIHFIAPVQGRREALGRFLKNYEEICLKNKLQTRLILVDYDPEGSEDFLRLKTTVEQLNSIYKAQIEILKGDTDFSRAKALQQGALYCSDDALLFFIDLDIVFDLEAVNRVLRNTIEGGSAYFPIVFSQYNPGVVCHRIPDQCAMGNFFLSQSRGYWRHFGFGIASIFRRDFLKTGGFDLEIRGWGREDVDLYAKSVSSHLTVNRAPDPGLVHVFHPTNCPNTLPESQMKMCLGTMRSNFAPAKLMSQFIYDNLFYFDRQSNQT